MNYAEAKQIAAEHAPNLLVDPEVEGQPHINVRSSNGGAPFSIHLVDSSHLGGDAEADKKTFVDALDAACKHLGVAK